MASIKDILDIVEIRTKAVSIATLSVSAAYVFAVTGGLDPVLFALVCIAALLVDMGTTGFNTWFDYWQGTDSMVWNMEPQKVLVHKGISPTVALLVSVTCFVLSAIPGIMLAYFCGFWVLAWGGLCMLVGFCYTGGPAPISRSPFGEFFAGGFLGCMLFLITIRILGLEWSMSHLLAALPLTLWIGSILAFNNLCDREGDRLAGRRTLAVLAGETTARRYAYAWLWSGVTVMAITPLVTRHNPMLSLMAVLGCLACMPTMIKMHKNGYSHARKGPTMQGILRMFMILSASQAAAYIGGRLLLHAS